MKFKDKDGTVLEDLKRAHLEFCAGRHCKDCVLNQDPTNDCVDLRLNNPAEAARLMGYEVVEDEKEDSKLTCYREGGCGPYETRACNECPASKPEYAAKEAAETEVVEGMCCDCANSGPCCDWSENMCCPDWKEDGSCWRPYTGSEEESKELKKEVKKKDNMDKRGKSCTPVEAFENIGQKPRICEVLGVEVGERFAVEGFPDTKAMWIGAVGTYFTEPGQAKNSSYAMMYAIQHPESIVRKPRFTEEEVADARAIMRLHKGATVVERKENRLLYLTTDTGYRVTAITLDLFPSIRPGQSVKLSEIVGGAE